MNWRAEWKRAALILGIFLACFYLPIGSARFDGAILEALHLAKWYAREHVLLCLIPAFFIAGAIGVFVGQASVMRYLGAGANRVVAYAVASVSGTILAVCSCTVLPLFAGIYRMGAGLGPACAFLYSGPAINVLAIVLTARILGLELGVARAVGAILFSVILGLLMQLIFRNCAEEEARIQAALPESEEGRPLWQTGIYFALMVTILVFANWGVPQENSGIWGTIYAAKWWIVSFSAFGLGAVLKQWFGMSGKHLLMIGVAIVIAAVLAPGHPGVPFSVAVVLLSFFTSRSDGAVGEWFETSWGFALQILPLLFGGVLIAGMLLGRVGEEGLIPSSWIAHLVGGNSFRANAAASVIGAFMYFATLTEVPIVQGLIGAGMGRGPALALLLAGPALSLPNMLVIRSVLGTRKTAVFIVLVIVLATATGMLFGTICP